MYTDSIIRIKNALARNKERVKIPYSRFDESILESLVKYGYLEEISRKGRGVKRIVEVKLKYDKDDNSPISGMKIISRPSRRMYVGWRDVKRSHQGYGHFFLSTPKGIMVGKEARKNKVGGELLFEIW
ncbi:MAG: 30S ribosomal protein S8 [Candidatus Colwellbacteria bacterium RIFCSPHIGHO2_12_FULL_43_12]|uniref:Small ribosomal subunit protein uS8 n=3 Tax=Candidatus Colwelliibacteriota TaxID=1817904 RepID=A0A1G1YY09_9BACT|nr:MAG: 30S ribosomal protein S8 [Candidatus Colwellbacteria bacterium RIFCSPHIGHO2_02_FULL_43_15]OGY58345.1 MAG: 30S ribosomal protein S8 [Candidatus Colwellbacteria bacterium RIFCSPHIGHO2_12_FULL_43_12]OGY60715.1 MAG: 30S ribosomal protein S8 [Candidatus Colwellbacteria bacterium RIFCSPLOWO2_12_FULL_43_11]